MTPADWQDPALSFACVELRKASGTPVYADTEYAVFLAFNAGDAFELTLPPAPDGQRWSRHINTAAALAPPEELCTPVMHVAAQSVSALVLERVNTPTPEGAA